MAATLKESDVQVTFDDQQRINKFARHNAKLQDLLDELKTRKKDLQNLEDAADELLMLDDEPTIPYMIGEVFISLTPDDTTKMIDRSKDEINEELAAIETKCTSHKETLEALKVQLYAKFGTNINLENEEESK